MGDEVPLCCGGVLLLRCLFPSGVLTFRGGGYEWRYILKNCLFLSKAIVLERE